MPNFFLPRFPFYNYHNYKITPATSFNTLISAKHLQTKLDSSTFLSNTNKNKSNCSEKSNKKDPLLEIFGINLFFDDILIICLLFFLYSEGVKDEMLFIVLILLLIT